MLSSRISSSQLLTNAFHAYQRAHLCTALEVLAGETTVSALVLQARALLRLRRPQECLEILHRCLTLHPLDAESLMVIGAAHSLLGELDEAASFLDRAHLQARTTNRYVLISECSYHCSRLAYLRGNYEGARAFALAALDDLPEASRRFPLRNPLLITTEHVRARAYDSLGLIQAQNGSYQEQLQLLLKGKNELSLLSFFDDDVYEESILFARLANIVCEIRSGTAVDEISQGMKRIIWTDDLHHEHVHALEAMAWAHALDGDILSAGRDLDDAIECADSPETFVSAIVAEAHFYHVIGSEQQAEKLTEHADQLASHISWEKIDREDRYALLHLSEELAARNPERARSLLKQYQSFQTIDEEPKILAWERYIDGLISKKEMNLNRAVSMQLMACEMWEDLDFHWHAALAALELCELGFRESHFGYLKREMEDHPHSWISEQARKML